MAMDNVRKRGDFNPDLSAVFSPAQLKKLKAELKELDGPVNNAMAETKNRLSKKVREDIQKKKLNVDENNVQDLLKFYAAEDFSDPGKPQVM